MKQRLRKRSSWAPAMLAALGLFGCFGSPCPAQQAEAHRPRARASWTPLGRALQATVGDGVPTLVVVTSRTEAGSLGLCRAMTTAPEIVALSGSIRLSEMAAELYKAQVEKLGIRQFPTLIVYRRGKGGLQAVAATSGLTEPGQVVRWLGLIGLASHAASTADPQVVRTGHGGAEASGQAYPSGQHVPPPVPPSKQPMAPPYIPPPAPPVQAPPPAAPMVPQAYMAPYPSPAPVYVQPPTPTMVVQQAPQQIVLAPAPPPQITVAMAPTAMPTISYAPIGGAPPTAGAPPMNLFTQPAQAPPAAAPPAGAPPAAAPPAQPVMMAPVAMAPPAMAPPAQAPPAVGQGPIGATVLAMTLTNPSLIGRLLGTIGEHFAQKKNPRIQMAQAPAMSPAPAGVAQAPVALAPVGQAGYAYAPVGQPGYGYAPVGQPGYGYVPVTPEATSFAPCNTYHAPCKYHGGPCPGPGGQYAPPPPSGPSASPQAGAPYGYAPAPHAPRKSVLSRILD